IHRVLRAMDPSLDVKAPASEWGMGPAEQVEYARQRHVLLPAEMSGGVAGRTPAACPDEPALVDVRFERGGPVATNQVTMPLGDLVTSLDILTAAHGAGSGALGALHTAHSALQQAALPADANAFCAEVAEQYARLLHGGSWFTPLRLALDAFLEVIQRPVAGRVRLKLFKGACEVVATDVSALQP